MISKKLGLFCIEVLRTNCSIGINCFGWLNEELIKEQGRKGETMYDYIGDKSEISWWSQIKIFIGKLVFKAKPLPPSAINTDVITCYNYFYQFIESLSESEKAIFL